MEKYIKRETYLRQLIDRMDNGEVKIVTGPRRSGKSWLLNRIFKDYLLEQGVAEENIIIVSFDLDDEEETGDLTDRQTLKSYLYSRITDAASPYYINNYLSVELILKVYIKGDLLNFQDN